MSYQINIKINYIYNLLYQILTILIPIVTAPYMARVFGPEGVGIQSYTNSVVTYFVLLAALGTASYGQREIARERDDIQKRSKLFWEIEILSMITTCIAVIIWGVIISFSSDYRSYYIALTMNVIAVAFDISWFFSGMEMFKYIVLRNAAFKLLGLLILFFSVKSRNDLLLYIALISMTGVLGNLSMWTYLHRFLVKVDFRSLDIFYHFKYTITYFIPTIASSIYTVMDKTMIGLISDKAENGYYEQATKIIHIAQSLLLSLNTVMTSRMSYLFSVGKIDEIKDRILRTFDFLLLLAIPIMFGLSGIAGGFVPWFFGTGYDQVVIIICCLSPLPLIICISNVLGSHYLTPSGQRVRSSKGIITGASVNLVCNFFLIRIWGALGAAVASVIAEMVISVIYMYMSKGYITWKALWIKCWKRFFAGMIMAFSIYLIGAFGSTSILTTVVQIVFGAIIYGILLILLKDKFLLLNLKKCFKYLKG